MRIGDERRNKYKYDKKDADKVVAFLTKRCKNVKGPLFKQNLKLIDWQEDFVRRLFGEKLPNGIRRYSYGFLWIPKKQGKSTMTSGLALYLLGPDDEPGAEVYGLAGDKDQARIIFGDASAMVELDPILSREFKVKQTEIRYPRKKGIFKALSAESKTKHGFNVHGGIFDELHVQPNDKLWDTITKGVAARTQPMILSLSNAGIKQTFAHEIYEMCIAAQSGEKDLDHWLVRNYEDQYPEDDKDYFNLERLKACNPSYGKTVGETYYKRIIAETRQRPSSLNQYLRLHLGKWVGAYENWLPISELTSTYFQEPVEILDFIDYECYIGIDLSSSRDMTSIVFLFDTFEELGYFTWIPWAFSPIEKIDTRTEHENVNYRKWVDEKLLKPTPGNTIDLKEIFDDFVSVAQHLDIVGLGYDAWRADDFVVKSQDSLGIRVTPVTQTTKYLSRPTEIIERSILKNWLRTNPNSLIEWQFDNVQLYYDTNKFFRISKDKSKDKVDVWSALVNAFAVWEHYRIKRKKPDIFTVEEINFGYK